MKSRLILLLLAPFLLNTLTCTTVDTAIYTEDVIDIEVTEVTETTIVEPETAPTEITSPVEDIVQPTTPEVYMESLGVFKLTAYCSCQKCCGKYAINRPNDKDGNEIVYGSTGVRLKAGLSIAVDPNVIPYGSKVEINGNTYEAHDTGGSIRGNRIDVYFNSHQDALNFGVRHAEVFLYKNS